MKFLAFFGLLLGVNAITHIPINRPPLPIPTNFLIETENEEYTPEGIKLYQGDMILSEEQLEWYQEGPAEMRKAINDTKYRWPNGVVQWRLTESSVKDREVILKGMQHWTENSCITFQEVDENYQGPHLQFMKSTGCFSFVGRLEQNGQVISIGYGCEEMGTVAHEIGHALGFHHEQSRPDRDNYLVILENNIYESKKHNFKLEKNTNTYQVAYDVSSLMHYGPDGFSQNGRNTMVTRDPFKHFVIGNREKLSWADLKAAHLMYNCADRCGQNNCRNGGYLDKYCRCQCPPGTTGDYCSIRVPIPSDLKCGGLITNPTSINTPNFPNYFPKDSQCVWVVEAPVGRRIEIRFEKFEMTTRWEEKNWCIWDFLEIRWGENYDGERYCGVELDRGGFSSYDNKMTMIFRSVTDYFPGFKANIKFV